MTTSGLMVRLIKRGWLLVVLCVRRRHCGRRYTIRDFRRDLFFKLGALLAGEYDVLVLEDLDVRNLVQKGETKKRRRMRLYDSSFSELRPESCARVEAL